MRKFSLNLEIVFESSLSVRLSAYHETTGNVVLIDILTGLGHSEDDFYRFLEIQARYALNHVHQLQKLKFVGYHKNGGLIEFSEKDILCGRYPSGAVSSPHLAQDSPQADRSLHELVDFLIAISSFDNCEYQVEKLGYLMARALKYNREDYFLVLV